MTDAELIALAAVVNASCTEIAAANQMRANQGCAPYYQGYQDIGGGPGLSELMAELRRREERDKPGVCSSCKTSLPMKNLYRCSRCGTWFCSICCINHNNVECHPAPAEGP